MQFLPEIGSGAQATPACGGCWEGLRPSAEFHSAPEPPTAVSSRVCLVLTCPKESRIKKVKIFRHCY